MRDVAKTVKRRLNESNVADALGDNIYGIAFVDGKDIEFDTKYDRLVKNPNIKFRRPEEFSDDDEDYNL